MIRLALCLVALASFFTPAAWAQASSAAMGQRIATGQYLQSDNKSFVAVQQDDGNFCIYRGTPTRYEGGALWCHNQVAPGKQFVTVLHTDGNLCTSHAGGNDTWCSNAVAGTKYRYGLKLQDDGNLCVSQQLTLNVLGKASFTASRPVWCALTGKIKTATIGTGVHCFDVYNNSNASVWVTFYNANGTLNPPIIGTACLQPGQVGQALVGSCNLNNAFIRGELTRNANCQHPVACDTTITMKDVSHNDFRSVAFNGGPGGCWLDFVR